MIFWVGIADWDWYEHLSSLQPDEINFRQPGPTPPKRMEPGTLFLFFFPEQEWIPIPENWKSNIQRGLTYDVPPF